MSERKRAREGEREREREHEIGGNSIPLTLSISDGCAMMSQRLPINMSLTQRQKKPRFTALVWTSLTSACISTLEVSLSLCICIILSLMANDRWRSCRSSEVIEDLSSCCTTEWCLPIFWSCFHVCLPFATAAQKCQSGTEQNVL